MHGESAQVDTATQDLDSSPSMQKAMLFGGIVIVDGCKEVVNGGIKTYNVEEDVESAEIAEKRRHIESENTSDERTMHGESAQVDTATQDLDSSPSMQKAMLFGGIVIVDGCKEVVNGGIKTYNVEEDVESPEIAEKRRQIELLSKALESQDVEQVDGINLVSDNKRSAASNKPTKDVRRRSVTRGKIMQCSGDLAEPAEKRGAKTPAQSKNIVAPVKAKKTSETQPGAVVEKRKPQEDSKEVAVKNREIHHNNDPRNAPSSFANQPASDSQDPIATEQSTTVTKQHNTRPTDNQSYENRHRTRSPHKQMMVQKEGEVSEKVVQSRRRSQIVEPFENLENRRLSTNSQEMQKLFLEEIQRLQDIEAKKGIHMSQDEQNILRQGILSNQAHLCHLSKVQSRRRSETVEPAEKRGAKTPAQDQNIVAPTKSKKTSETQSGVTQAVEDSKEVAVKNREIHHNNDPRNVPSIFASEPTSDSQDPIATEQSTTVTKQHNTRPTDNQSYENRHRTRSPHKQMMVQKEGEVSEKVVQSRRRSETVEPFENLENRRLSTNSKEMQKLFLEEIKRLQDIESKKGIYMAEEEQKILRQGILSNQAHLCYLSKVPPRAVVARPTTQKKEAAQRPTIHNSLYAAKEVAIAKGPTELVASAWQLRMLKNVFHHYANNQVGKSRDNTFGSIMDKESAGLSQAGFLIFAHDYNMALSTYQLGAIFKIACAKIPTTIGSLMNFEAFKIALLRVGSQAWKLVKGSEGSATEISNVVFDQMKINNDPRRTEPDNVLTPPISCGV
eukprot:Platyproteum_vivax@DN7657_c0_g1_i4.p1